MEQTLENTWSMMEVKTLSVEIISDCRDVFIGPLFFQFLSRYIWLNLDATFKVEEEENTFFTGFYNKKAI